MAQHDYVIDNADGATVRTDLNSLFEAVATLNSGGTAPSPTFAFMWWADTSTGLLKIRNEANNAWITIGTLATSGFGALTDPTTTRGDIIKRGISAIERLAVGTGVLKANGTDVSGWSLLLNADIDAAAAIALSKLATQPANTLVANGTGSVAVPTAVAIGAGLTFGGSPLTLSASGSAASQSDMETATSTTVMVTPGRQHFHPSAAKCWGRTTGGGVPVLAASYNVTSVSDTGVGVLTVTIADDFSSANYSAVANVISAAGANLAVMNTVDSLAAGSFVIRGYDAGSTPQDPQTGWTWTAFGNL
jgi:hypothetical protein